MNRPADIRANGGKIAPANAILSVEEANAFPAESLPGRWGRVALVVSIWTVFGLFQAVPNALSGFSWSSFAGKMIEAWCWAALTPAMLWIDRRLAMRRPSVLRILLTQFGLGIVFATAQTCLAAVVEYPIAEIWWSPIRSPDYFTFYFLGGWTTYVAFIGIVQALRYSSQFMTTQLALERVEKRLIEARLNALRSQLEPHFLFNTLNTISSEVVANPDLARDMIEDLGALLRGSLDCQDSTEITLAKELALLDHYIAIQKLRFGKRVKIKIDVDPEALSTGVPSMLLQPLVENAIRHGIEPKLSGGIVKITAAPVGDGLVVKVTDDGVGLPPNWKMEECDGLGVRVTRERLETLYSGTGHFSFSISRRKGGGTEVAIRIPLHQPGGDTVATAA